MSDKISIEKNYGIELLRIIAMLMIVVLHVLGKGGALGNVYPGSTHYNVAWILEIICFGAVNIYALISGYVLCDKSFHLSRLINLFFSIAFYTILIYFLMIALGYESITIEGLIYTFFPISSRHYWYLSSYFGLLIMMPILNIALAKLKKRDGVLHATLGFLFICIMPCFCGKDPFSANAGLSTLWLCILYLVGGGIKKTDLVSKINSCWLIILFILMVLITFLSKVFLVFLIERYKLHGTGSLLVSYTSPTIVASSIAIFCLFVKKTFTPFSVKVITFLSPMTLAVYIIHDNLLIRKHFVKGFSSMFVDHNALIFVLLIIVASLAIYLSCSLVDYVRIKLFNFVHVREFSGYIERLVINFINNKVE